MYKCWINNIIDLELYTRDFLQQIKRSTDKTKSAKSKLQLTLANIT